MARGNGKGRAHKTLPLYYWARFLRIEADYLSVAILIDEYDKPIIDYLERSDQEVAHNNREILKTFYSGVKDLDKYIRFFLITGVSKFSRVSIFSDLNHLILLSVFFPNRIKNLSVLYHIIQAF